MGKNKLKKFAEMETLDCVYQYPFAELKASGACPLRGLWGRDVFHNDRPITLELGCGKGEYAVGMGRTYPDRNFIGIDIKGDACGQEHARWPTTAWTMWPFCAPPSIFFPNFSLPARCPRYGSHFPILR